MTRRTDDLELFSASASALSHIDGAVSVACGQIGATWREERTTPYFRRYRVLRGDEEMRLDLVHDPTPQLVEEKNVVDGVRVDPVDEILANKICAVVGRSEPRDLWDIHQLVLRGLDFDQALANATRKEGGVDAESLLFVLQACHWPTFEAACAAAGLTGAEDVSLFFQTLAKRLALGLLP